MSNSWIGFGVELFNHTNGVAGSTYACGVMTISQKAILIFLLYEVLFRLLEAN